VFALLTDQSDDVTNCTPYRYSPVAARDRPALLTVSGARGSVVRSSYEDALNSADGKRNVTQWLP